MEGENNERNPQTPDSGKKKKGAFPVKPVAAAVIVFLVAVTATNAKALANTMKKTFSSPTKYYRSVEQNGLTDSVENLTELYEQLAEAIDLGAIKQSVTVSAEAGPKVQKAIKKASGVDISELGEVSVSVDVVSKKDMVGFGTSLAAGKKNIISVNGLLDIKNLTAYLQIPELTKKYLGIAGGEMFGISEDDLEAYDEAKEIAEALPTKKELEKIFSRYVKAALSEVKNVTKSTEKIEAGEVSEKCTALIVELDEEDIAAMLEAVLKEIEKDKDLKKLFLRLNEVLGDGDEDAYDEFLEELTDALENAIENIEDTDLDLTMTVYVDGKGEIHGRRLEIKSKTSYEDWYGESRTDVQEMELELLSPVNGTKVGFLATLKNKDGEGSKQTLFKVDGSGKVSLGKLSGEYKIKAAGLTVAEVSVKSLDAGKLRDGILNGTFTVSASDTVGRFLEGSLPQDLRRVLEEMGINLGKVSLEITLENGAKFNQVSVRAIYKEELLFRISVARDVKAEAATKLPSEKNVVWIEDEDEMEEWLEECDFDGFIKNLRKTSLPEEFVDYAEEFFDKLE